MLVVGRSLLIGGLHPGGESEIPIFCVGAGPLGGGMYPLAVLWRGAIPTFCTGAGAPAEGGGGGGGAFIGPLGTTLGTCLTWAILSLGATLMAVVEADPIIEFVPGGGGAAPIGLLKRTPGCDPVGGGGGAAPMGRLAAGAGMPLLSSRVDGTILGCGWTGDTPDGGCGAF